LRLVAATLIGCAVGFNRDLHGKPTGIRTMGIIGLTSSLLVTIEFTPAVDGSARGAVYGIITGFGFLGAGVIIKETGSVQIHGLTTAASILLVAAMGIACGMGAWTVVVPACVLAFALLVFAGPFESWVRKRSTGKTDRDAPP
jgi:putative Mg2+ transporter-C (MgtC) family protein